MVYKIKPIKDKIRPVREYFEVYIDGKFYCSADSWREAENEIKNYITDKKGNQHG